MQKFFKKLFSINVGKTDQRFEEINDNWHRLMPTPQTMNLHIVEHRRGVQRLEARCKCSYFPEDDRKDERIEYAAKDLVSSLADEALRLGYVKIDKFRYSRHSGYNPLQVGIEVVASAEFVMPVEN